MPTEINISLGVKNTFKLFCFCHKPRIFTGEKNLEVGKGTQEYHHNPGKG